MVIDSSKMKLYFGLQEGGIGQISLENRNLGFSDKLDGRRILTAITLCSGENTDDSLFFGTRDEIIKYNLEKG